MAAIAVNTYPNMGFRVDVIDEDILYAFVIFFMVGIGVVGHQVAGLGIEDHIPAVGGNLRVVAAGAIGRRGKGSVHGQVLAGYLNGIGAIAYKDVVHDVGIRHQQVQVVCH